MVEEEGGEGGKARVLEEQEEELQEEDRAKFPEQLRANSGEEVSLFSAKVV